MAEFVDALWTGDVAAEVPPPDGRNSMQSPFEDEFRSVGWEDEELLDEIEHK